ncbi:MAG TPA: guanylate kinase [Gemmatimonadaceae bacterium]|nr:guanylate kinase [Gemmatimonadaceae bacterium]
MNPFPLVLSAPSGGGKTTIARELLAKRSDVGYSISCTTRPARAGEVEGRDYFFLSAEEFRKRRERGEFAECAEVHGHWYGTLRKEIERVIAKGKHVILDIDVQGAAQLAKAFPHAVLVFVLPPSAGVLLERLRARKTEDRASLARRMTNALKELRHAESYQYVVTNDDLEGAVGRVSAIIDAEMSRRERVHGLEEQVRSLIERLEQEVETHSSIE